MHSINFNEAYINNCKKILITGVSRGIGLALAEEFANLGHIILGCSSSYEKIEEIKERFSHPHKLNVVDVSSNKQIEQWKNYLLKENSMPDIIINNAAVINKSALFWEISPSEFDNLMQINIMGTANILRNFLPAMLELKRGVIINMSSDWGRSVSPKVVPYCTSKWAIEGLTKALSTELPKGIIAVSLSPDIVATSMLKSCLPEEMANAPSPRQWAKVAALRLLELNGNDNGKEITISVPST